MARSVNGVATDKLVDPEALRRYGSPARLLDQAFRIPGTSWRFGIDPILGLIPGAGDIVTAILGGYGVLLARQLGAPASVQMRMMLNLVVDGMVGAIPLLGDLFDFAFKAHMRNLALLEHWLSKPHQARRSSLLLLIGGLLGVLALIVGAVWVVVASIRALFTLVA